MYTSNNIAKLIEDARKEVHDFWSDPNTPEHTRLLKQLREIEGQQEKLLKEYHEQLNSCVYDDPLGVIAQKEYQIEQQKLLDADLYERKSETPKETIYRKKDNGSYHVSNLKDGVLDPIEIEKLYYEPLVSDINFQKLYDSCLNQNTRSTNHTSQ